MVEKLCFAQKHLIFSLLFQYLQRRPFSSLAVSLSPFLLALRASVFKAILQNSCTSSLNNPVTLLYLSNASPGSYTFYTYSYRSTAGSATITVALRQDPSFFALDDISISLSAGGPNLVQNPGFETGSLTGYFAFCNPSSSSASGVVRTGCAHSGSYCYYDGSVGNPDYISQTMAVIPYTYYTVSFWLQNLGGPTNSFTMIISG